MRTSWSAALAVVLVLLAGCRPTGVDIPPGSESLEPCPIRQIAVETLEELGAPGCDLAGSTLAFDDPLALKIMDGRTAEIGPVGNAPRYGGPATNPDNSPGDLHVTNWGVPGVAVTVVAEKRIMSMWASTSEAEELERKSLRQAGIE